MSEKVKKNFARFYKLRYSRFNIFDACLTTLIVLLFITLLRPASVRSEHNLDGCGSHCFLPHCSRAGQLWRAAAWPAENEQPARAADDTHNVLLQSPDKAGRWSGASHRPAENEQLITADDNTKTSSAKAGGTVEHCIRNRPPDIYDQKLATEDGQKLDADFADYAEDWLDKLLTKIHVVESGGQLEPPDGDGGRAVGALQLHKCVVDDVNRHYQTNFSYADRRDFPKARLIARLYIRMWLDAHKEEIACRIFNGGPRGWQKTSTDAYWKRIKNIATENIENTEELK